MKTILAESIRCRFRQWRLILGALRSICLSFFEVETDKVRTLQGSNNISYFNKTRVVAMVVNGKNGKPLNCISSIYPNGEKPGESAVQTLEEADITATSYYDLQGRMLSEPSKGLNVVKETLSNGTYRTKKVIVK